LIGIAGGVASEYFEGVGMRGIFGVCRSRVGKVGAGLAVFAAVVGGGVQTAAADADVPYLRTDPSTALSGYGVALNGSVSFYNRHSASYYFEVYDRCDGEGHGDGYSAMMRGRVIRGDGTVTAWSGWEGDDTGCADNAGRLATNYWTLSDRLAVRLEVQLCLREPGTGYLAGCVERSWHNQNV
jgi:hypothetical protein